MYYYTLPGFTWDAMGTYVNFELLTDIDIYNNVYRARYMRESESMFQQICKNQQ